MPISEELLKHELQYTAKLDRKHRGELAELAFMRRAAALGFAVAKPWGDCDRYDVIVRLGKVFCASRSNPYGPSIPLGLTTD